MKKIMLYISIVSIVSSISLATYDVASMDKVKFAEKSRKNNLDTQIIYDDGKDTVTKETKGNGNNSTGYESEETSNKNKVSAVEDEETAPVFKVNRESLLNYLTNGEKIELLKIVGFKLSFEDRKNLYNTMFNDSLGDKEIVKSVENILKERLSSSEYKKVMNIANKYVNLAAVN